LTRYLEFDGTMEQNRVNRSWTLEELRKYRKCSLSNDERDATRAKFWRESGTEQSGGWQDIFWLPVSLYLIINCHGLLHDAKIKVDSILFHGPIEFEITSQLYNQIVYLLRQEKECSAFILSTPEPHGADESRHNS
jgi:hypothetical protein